MSFAAGLIGGIGSAKIGADRQRAMRQRPAPMTHGPDGAFGDPYARQRPDPHAPLIPFPLNPNEDNRAGDPRRGTFANSSGQEGATASDPLIALVDRTEGAGRYDTLFGHSQRSGPFAGVDVSRMTLGELKQFASPSGDYGRWVKDQVGRVATPMGRHQIVGTTLRRTQSALGLPDDTVFDATTQNRMFHHLARQRLSSASSLRGKMQALRAEWEGFKHVPDEELARAIVAYEGGTS